MNFEQRKKEMMVDLAKVVGSNEPLSMKMSAIDLAFSQSLSDYKKELVEEINKLDVLYPKDYMGRYIIKGQVLSLLQKDKEDKG